MLRKKIFGSPVTYITPDGVKVTAYPSIDFPRLYRVAVYCRVSTMHADQMDSLKAQIEYYQEYVNRHSGWLLVGVYQDVQSARSIHAREQFEKMIQDCLNDKIDIVITKTVSRFGRNTIDTLNTLRKLKTVAVDIFFENEGIHSNNDNDEHLISLLSIIAENENKNRSDNIKWGIKRQVKNPDAPIYKRPCYGYRKSKDGILEVFEDEAATVRLIFSLYLSGYSIIKIKQRLEERCILSPSGKAVWAKRTIETILSNEKYAGDVIVYKTYCAEYPDGKRVRNNGEHERFAIYDNHPAITAKEYFARVQDEKQHRSNIAIDAEGRTARKDTHYSMKSKPE